MSCDASPAVFAASSSDISYLYVARLEDRIPITSDDDRNDRQGPREQHAHLDTAPQRTGRPTINLGNEGADEVIRMKQEYSAAGEGCTIVGEESGVSPFVETSGQATPLQESFKMMLRRDPRHLQLFMSCKNRGHNTADRMGIFPHTAPQARSSSPGEVLRCCRWGSSADARL